MLIEQIRYFVDEDKREELLVVRREIDRFRTEAGMPPGHILLSDDTPSGGPTVVWQCGYEDEGQMGLADAQLIGNAEYEAARERLASLVQRVELELYTSDDEE
jgi:hypothetical protein